MKSKIKSMGLLLILLLAGTIITQAQSNNIQPGFRDRAFYRIPDLTEKQKTDLMSLSQKHQVRMDTLYAMLQKSTDIQKRGDIAKDMQIERDTHRQSVLGLLTDSQKAAFNSASRPVRSGRGPMMARRDMRGPGRGMGQMNRNPRMGAQGRGMSRSNRDHDCFMKGHGRGMRNW
jgi:hypothetical protein